MSEQAKRASRAVVAFGANLGDRRATLDAAVDEIRVSPCIRVVAVSPWHESVALTVEGRDDSKPAYLNGVAILETDLAPDALLDRLAEIELAHGRVRVERWGDRTLDLDIVDFDGRTVKSERLTLPHPRAAERDFVLGPWLEINPDASLAGRRVDALLADLRVHS